MSIHDTNMHMYMGTHADIYWPGLVWPEVHAKFFPHCATAIAQISALDSCHGFQELHPKGPKCQVHTWQGAAATKRASKKQSPTYVTELETPLLQTPAGRPSNHEPRVRQSLHCA